MRLSLFRVTIDVAGRPRSVVLMLPEDTQPGQVLEQDDGTVWIVEAIVSEDATTREDPGGGPPAS